MIRLTGTELRAKLAFEYELVTSLVGPTLEIRGAFESAEDACQSRRLSDGACRVGRAAVYDITYIFPIPISPDATTAKSTARFDLLAGGNFPATPPLVTFVGRPLPFTPHVQPATGLVCLGDGFRRAEGMMLVAELVRHVMRLLNYDEPTPGPSYAGYSVAAIRWWASRGYRPFDPDLVYPTLDPKLTHGVPAARPTFRVASTESIASHEARMVAPRHEPSAALFRPSVGRRMP